MAITKKQLKELRKINKMNEKELKTITMADLGNHVACYDCKHKDKRIAELEKENKELKNNQSKIALEKLYAIENILIDMHTNEESFEDISESVSIIVSDMISGLERGIE